jgi:protein-S-isoprenylcysteine O-methyltransferase Ste14
MTLGFGVAWRFPAAAIAGHQSAWFFLGIGCMLAGVALRWYAIWVLGRYFTRDVATHPGQHVVTTGPYRWIRHPSYAGGLLTCFGVGLALTNWLSILAIMGPLGVGYLYRVRVEELALGRALGSEYLTYMRHTKRFIPGLF